MLTKEQIENSMEAKWRKRQMRTDIILFSVMTAIVFLVVFLALATDFSMKNVLFALKFLGIIFAISFSIALSNLLFIWYQYKKLFQNLEQYTVYEVTLDKPSLSAFYRGAFYYTVSIPLSSSGMVKRDTKPLWSDGIFVSIRIADYNNQEIKIAYSESLDKLIVLGK